jgi:hypothetical protein
MNRNPRADSSVSKKVPIPRSSWIGFIRCLEFFVQAWDGLELPVE